MNHLRDKYKVWRIERSILTCYFFIWCQECRIVGFFFSCQVLVSNNALAQYFKTQRCESFESLEKLFSSSLFVVFPSNSAKNFFTLFFGRWSGNRSDKNVTIWSGKPPCLDSGRWGEGRWARAFVCCMHTQEFHFSQTIFKNKGPTNSQVIFQQRLPSFPSIQSSRRWRA